MTVYEQLADFASLDSFWNRFDSTFATNYDLSLVQELRTQWQQKDFSQLPQIEVVGTEILKGAKGGYSSNSDKIYISNRLLETSAAETLQAVILEEIGHWVDAKVNRQDTLGDEGELFSDVVRGVALSSSQLAGIKQENDHFQVLINGQSLQIEAAGSISDAGVRQVREGLDAVLSGLQESLYRQLLNNITIKSAFGDRLENTTAVNNSLQYLNDIRLKLSAINVTNYLPDQLVTEINRVLTGTGTSISYSATTDEFSLNITRSQTNALAINTNLGFSNVGLNFAGNVNLTAGFTGRINFSASGSSFSIKPTAGKELSFTLSARNATGLTGKLGFLDLTASNNGSNNAFSSDFSLAADINSGGGIEAVNPTASLKINTLLSLSGGQYLPTFKTNLTFDASNPNLQFSNVTLGLGSVVQIVNPFIKDVKGITGKFKPVLDFLNAPLPVLGEFGLNYSLLDLAENPIFKAYATNYLKLPPIDTSFIRSLTTVSNIIKTLDNVGNSGDVSLGSFSLNNLSQFNLSNLSNPNIANFSGFSNGLASARNQFENALKNQPTSTKVNIFATAGAKGQASFDFSILQNPASAFGLMLGKGDVDLFKFTLPGLTVKTGGTLVFPIWPVPPVTIGFGGQIGATLPQTTYGFDATGLLKYKNSGNFENISEGLYLDTKAGQYPGFYLDSKLFADINAGIRGIASVGGEAYIKGALNFALNDPNQDSKIRWLEIKSNASRGFSSLFDISGGVSAGANIYVEYPTFNPRKWFSGKVFEKKNIVEIGPFPIPGLQFAAKSSSTVNLSPSLGVLNSGNLRLNIGNFASARTNNKQDVSEVYTLTGGSNITLVGPTQGQDTESFSGVTSVSGNAGFGNDNLNATGLGVAVNFAGGVGNDQLAGGNQNDTLAGGDGDDVLYGNGGTDVLTGESGTDQLYGGDGADTLTGGDGNDLLEGNAGADTLRGGLGVDILKGGTDNDTLEGGLDNDTLQGDDGDDSLSGGFGEDLLQGGNQNDTLLGGYGNDNLQGGEGDDRLEGEQGDDRLLGEGGNDTLIGGSGNDLLSGGIGNDTFTVDLGTDTVSDLSSGDVLVVSNGAIANVTVTAAFTATSTTANRGIANINTAGNAVNLAAATGTNGYNVTNSGGAVALTGSNFADSITGGTGDEVITGNSGDDILTGGAGNDSLIGGAGNDTFRIDLGTDTLSDLSGSDVLLVNNGATVNATVSAAFTATSATINSGTANINVAGNAVNLSAVVNGNGYNLTNSGIAAAITGSNLADTVTGGSGNDSLSGSGGNDTLIGGAGNDSLVGGTGNDTFNIDLGTDTLSDLSGSDVLLVSSGATVNATVTAAFIATSATGNQGTANINAAGNTVNLDAATGTKGYTVTNSGVAASLTGSQWADTISGGTGNDTISGGEGDDQLAGGTGLNTLLGDFGNDTLIGGSDADLMLGGTGNDNLQGAGGNDTLYGGYENDTLDGGTENDRLYGEAGNDSLSGGTGDDWLSGDGQTDPLLGGNDTLYGQGGNDTLMGGELDDQLYGGTEDDQLYGGTGSDTLYGGIGVDYLEGNEGDDVIVGTDTGNPSLDGSDTLIGGQGNDFLVGGYGNDVLNGNEDNDSLQGNEGNDILDGGSGNDVLKGALGFDSLVGGAGDDFLYGYFEALNTTVPNGDGNDVIDGGAGNDELWGSDGNDSLIGGTGNDRLFGDDSDNPLVDLNPNDPNPQGKRGNDTLDAGAGNDMLYGGLGDDVLKAGSGFDRLYGGRGNDTLIGYTGTKETNNDGVVFAFAPGSGTDTVWSFDKTKDVIFLTGGLSASFIKFEAATEILVDPTTTTQASGPKNLIQLIDLDTDQVLAKFVGNFSAQDLIGRIDEQNVPPDRLEFDGKKPIYAQDETISLVNAQVRDPNGAADIEKIDFWLKNPDGTWVDFRDVGLTGVKYGNADWGDFDLDGDLDVLITGYTSKVKSDGQRDAVFDLVPITKLYRYDKASNQFIEVFDLSNVQGTFDIVGATPPLAQLYDGTITWADFNKDGKLDILQMGSKSKGGFAIANIYLQNANGNFAAPIEVTLNTEVSQVVKWADFDGDNTLDLMMGRVVYRQWNNQSNQFAIATSYIDPLPKTSYVRQFGSSQNDEISSTILDQSGNLYISGNTWGSLPGNTAQFYGGDVFVGKYSPDGTRLWLNQLGSFGTNNNPFDQISSTVLDSAGNLYISGDTEGSLPDNTNQGGRDVFVAKYDSNGTRLWVRQHGSSSIENISFSVLDRLGNIYVSGLTGGSLPGSNSLNSVNSRNLFVAKYDPNGNRPWVSQLPSNNAAISSTALDESGNLYISGITYSYTLDGKNYNNGGKDVFVVKYDASGNRLWVSQLGTSSQYATYEKAISSSILDKAGNLYISGNTYGSLPDNTYQGNGDVFAVKYDANGTRQWARQLGSSNSENIRSTVLDAEGNLYVSGYTEGSLPGNTNQGGRDVFVAKYDANGTRQWVRQLGSSNSEDIQSTVLDTAGNLYVSGYTEGSLPGNTNQGGRDVFVAKYDSNGTRLWVRQLGSSNSEDIRSTVLDAADNLYVSGYTWGSLPGNTSIHTNGQDGFIAKYDANGNPLWVHQVGSSSYNYTYTNQTSIDSTVLNGTGTLYVSGYTYESLPGTNSAYQGGRDMFVAKFSQEKVNSSDVSDYDSDGKQDIVVTGSNELDVPYTRVYRQVNGQYQLVQELDPVIDGKAIWIDIQGINLKDDILLSGKKQNGDVITKLYRFNPSSNTWNDIAPQLYGTDNNRNGLLEQTEQKQPIPLPGTYQGDISWQIFTVGGVNEPTQQVRAIILTGFTGETRRTADGKNVPIPVTKIYQALAGGTVLFDTNIGLSGVANSSIQFQDYDGDNDLDLLVTGEDIFVRPEDQASLSSSQMEGGNPTTTIYRNDSYIDPTTKIPVLKFTNPIFIINENDKRWANFNYQFESRFLNAGVYELKGIAYDHATSGLELVPGYAEVTNLTTLTLSGTAGQNIFVIGNKNQNFYSTTITIQDFNPNLDQIQLYSNQNDYSIEDANGGNDTLIKVKSVIVAGQETSQAFLQKPNLQILIKDVNKSTIELSNDFTVGNIIFADPKRDDSQSIKFAITNSGTPGVDNLNYTNAYVIQKSVLDRELTGQFTYFGALAGGAGNDTLKGSQAINEILPGGSVGALITYLDGGSGDDFIIGSNLDEDGFSRPVTDILLGWEGNDTLQGLKGSNILDGGIGNDSLVGGGSQDTLIGGAGIDTLNGNGGADTAIYDNSPQGININLTNAVATNDGFGNQDTIVKVNNLSTIENVIGSNFGDEIVGDTENNNLSGLGGNDTINGSTGNDSLMGGTGNDSLMGGTDNDTLISGGGKDTLIGGTGVDTYIVRAPLFNLEEAFNVLGGDYKTKKPFTANINGQNKTISWEMFRLWAEPTRWPDNQVQWQRYREVGLEPDTTLYQQASTDSNIGWLRPLIGGTVIRDENSEADTLIIAANAPLSKTGLTVGKIGFVQSGNNLIIDLNQDGIANSNQDLTIENFFNGNQEGVGSIGTIQIAGLKATYYKGTDFTNTFATVIDPTVNFNWGDKAPPVLGNQPDNFGVIWQGKLKIDRTATYRFKVIVDDKEVDLSKDKIRLFVDGVLLTNPQQILTRNFTVNQEYDFRLEYLEKSGNANVQVLWSIDSAEDKDYVVIPEEQFLSPDTISAVDIINSNGDFTPVLQKNLGIAQTKGWNSKATFGDYNNDGYLDILVVGSDDYGSGIASIYINGADSNVIGGRGYNQTIPLNYLERYETAIWGDYNNDGYLDILATGINTIINNGQPQKQYQVKVLLNQQGQGFIEELITVGNSSFQANWADFNNDGRLDIITTNNQEIKIYLGGVTQFDVLSTTVTNGQINVGDLNNDGYLDFVVSGKEIGKQKWTSSSEVLDNSDPKFNRRENKDQYYYQDFDLSSITIGNQSLISGQLYSVSLSGSFDTYLEIISESGNKTSLIAFDDDSGEGLNSLLTFTYQEGYKIRVTSYAPFATDEQGNPIPQGNFQVEVQAVNNGVEIWQNNQGQNWTTKTQSQLKLEGSETVALGDYNDDGKLDLLLTGSDRTRIYRNDSNGNLQFSESIGKVEIGTLSNSSPKNLLRLGYNPTTGNYDLQDKYYKSYNLASFVKDPKKSELIVLNLSSSFDTYLQIVKPIANSNPLQYQLLAYDDDNGEGLNSQLLFEYTPDLENAGIQVWATTYSSNITREFILSSSGAGLPSISNDSASWGDFDNDGDLDVALSGLGDQSSLTKVFLNPLKNNTSIRTFSEQPALLPGLKNGSVTWGDYDKDGDLDLLVTGTLGISGTPYIQLYSNSGASKTNAKPITPTLATTPQVATPSGIKLTWNNVSGLEEEYTYNLKVGTTSGGIDVISPLAKNNGERNVSQIGNADYNTSYTLSDLPKGLTYYWSVQAIDNGYAGSAFSAESSFTTNPFSLTTQITPAVTPETNNLFDYDNDGDLDRLAVSSTQTILSRNDQGIFTPVNTTLPGAKEATWADYDNDGDLDFVLLTNTATSLYRNTNGSFAAVTTAFSGAIANRVTWGDYDNDGDLDLLLTDNNLTRSYNNNLGSFALSSGTLAGGANVVTGDYDQDGRLDVGIIGSGVTLYRGTANGFENYIDQITLSTPVSNFRQTYDLGNRLTLLFNRNAEGNSQVFRNDAVNINLAPTAPSQFQTLISGTTATLKWSGATDDKTPLAGLTYNLQIKNAAGATILSAPVDANGKPLQPKMGNVGQGKKESDGTRSWSIKGLAPGDYSWTVQALDNSYLSSSFSSAQSFSILPAISFNSATLSVTEGDSGQTTIPFTIKLSAASPKEIKVDYSVYASNTNTATQNIDFQELTGTLTFAPGVTTQTINLSVQGDELPESAETFTVSLQNPVNATVATQDKATITITSESSDGVVPTVSFVTPTLSTVEGDNGQSFVPFIVKLSAASSKEITVEYSIYASTANNNTATQNIDFQGLTGTLTFAPGETTQTINLQVQGDTLPESAETFTVSLQNPVNATVATQDKATITITSESSDGVILLPDLQLSQLISANQVKQGQTLDLAWTVQNIGLGGNSDTRYATYIYLSQDNQLSADDQFLNVNWQALPLPGAIQNLSQSITIPYTISGNQHLLLSSYLAPEPKTTEGLQQADEANPFNNSLSRPIAIATTLVPDLSLVSVIAPASGVAGGTIQVTSTVTNKGQGIAQAGWKIVAYLSMDGLVDGADYQLEPLLNDQGSTLAKDASTQLISQFKLPDTGLEQGKLLFTVVPANGDYDSNTQELPIVQDFTLQFPLPTITLNPYSAKIDAQGQLTVSTDKNILENGQRPQNGQDKLVYEFKRQGSTANALTINFTVGGTAQFTSDYSQQGATTYTASSGTITFAAGSNLARLTLTPIADTTAELDESLTITLTPNSTYTFDNTNSIHSISTSIDNDDIPVNNNFANGTTLTGSEWSITGSNRLATGESGELLILNDNLSNSVWYFWTAPTTGTYTLSTDDKLGVLGNNSQFDTLLGVFTGNAVNALTPIISDDDSGEGTNSSVTFTATAGIKYAISVDGARAADNTVPTTGNFVLNLQPVNSQPRLSISNVTVFESNANTLATVTVLLSQANSTNTTIRYSTANGTATSGSDYTAISLATLTFAPGEVAKTFTIPILTDSLPENDETFTITLSSPSSNAIIGTGTATITIKDPLKSSVTKTLTESDNPNLLLTGSSLINGIGNSQDNTLIGNANNNQLDGQAGNDTLNGSAGNDTLTGGLGNDSLVGGEGTDTVKELSGVDVILTNSQLIQLSLANPSNSTSQIDSLESIEQAQITGDSSNNIIDASGFSGPSQLNGGDGNDTLIGGVGNDALDGGNGNDNLTGGLGNDSLNGGAGTDILLESGDVNFTLTTSTNIQLVGNGTDTLVGIEEVRLTGGASNNTLNASNFTGNTILDGGLGNDILIGGKGNDIYIVDSIGDQITELAAQGADTIESSINFSLVTLTAIENLTLTGSQNLNAIGNDLANKITGNSGNNQLTGGLNNDTIDGGSGFDKLVESGNVNFILTNSQLIGNGTDTLISIEQAELTGGIGNNSLDASGFSAGDVTLNGGDGLDTLLGGKGNDWLTGGLGNDSLNGGDGIDTVVESGDINFILANAQLIGNGTDSLTSIEQAQLTGGASNNLLDASTFTGNTTLNGGAGIDTLKGGLGNDVYIVDTTTDVIVEAANSGNDTLVASVTLNLTDLAFSNIENLTLTGTGNLNGTGNSANNFLMGNLGNNTLIGNEGNDTLTGGGGNNTLIGGIGDDIYQIDNVTDVITELASQGMDTIVSSVSYSLLNLSNLENLTLVGVNNLIGTGNATNNQLIGNDGDNILTGAAGNDTLNGGAGIDTLIGGLGDDLYQIDTSIDSLLENIGEGTDTVQSSINYSLGTNFENLTLIGTDNIDGIGNELNNVLTGNSKDNSLRGGLGADTLIGGLGNDSLEGGLAADQLDGGSGLDTAIYSSSTSAVTVNLSLTTAQTGGEATGDVLLNIENIVGSNFGDILTGNSSDNILDGKAGVDTLIGGLGNDTYFVDNVGDVIQEASTLITEIDTVQSSISYTLGSNLEKLTLTEAAAINGTGNTLNNTLTGNGAANILDGKTGADILTGGMGSDRFNYKTLTDSLLGSTNSNFDIITDFNANGGNDLFLVTTARAGISTGLTVGTLTAAGIGSALTTANFAANFAAQFTFVSGGTTRTFVAINNATAGFSAATDALVEVTGLTGTLGLANFVTI